MSTGGGYATGDQQQSSHDSCCPKMSMAGRVARSTFFQGAKSTPEKSQTLTQGAKKGPIIFPILTAITKSYEPTLSRLLNGNLPQSQL